MRGSPAHITCHLNGSVVCVLASMRQPGETGQRTQAPEENGKISASHSVEVCVQCVIILVKSRLAEGRLNRGRVGINKRFLREALARSQGTVSKGISLAWFGNRCRANMEKKKPVKLIFWPWLAPYSVQKCVKFCKLFPPCSTAVGRWRRLLPLRFFATVGFALASYYQALQARRKGAPRS